MTNKIAINGLTALLLAGAMLSSAANAQAAQTSLLGDPVPATSADQTVVIGPNTKSVNVMEGDVVKFVVGDQAFAWDFDGASNVTSVDLNQVAPAGMLDHPVTVYVEPDPAYSGGG